MRYWIYWNDLVQGPFEVSELRALSAFTADLEVCEETGQEWAMVAAVPELLAHLRSPEPVYVPENSPLPPPPPQGPPNRSILQGELFLEPHGQQHLQGINGNPEFLFHPADENPELPTGGVPPIQTSPFRFFAPSLPSSLARAPMPESVIEPPAMRPLSLPPTPTPIEPMVVEESELGILEPEALPDSPSEVIEPKVELPRPVDPPRPVEPPRVIERPKVIEPAPQPIIPRPVTPEIRIQARMRPIAIPESTVPPPKPESFELDVIEPKNTRWWLWMLPVFAVLAGVGGWVFMRGQQRTVDIVALPPPVERAPDPPAPVVEVPPSPEVIEPLPPPSPAPKPKKPKAVKLKPVPVPALTPKPEPVPEPVTEPETVPFATVPGMSSEPVAEPPPPAEKPAAPDLWRGKENEAIDRVLKHKIFNGKRTIGENAKQTLLSMHDKELLHAAETGDRLYLPDKIGWSALREEGARYRVYLNFMAWNLNGERVQSRSDSFLVDLQKGSVGPADDASKKNFFEASGMVQHEKNPKADDIESVLSAVDTLNRHKLRTVILKTGKLSKEEQKSFQTAVDTAEKKFIKTIVYFRTKYAEKTLQNVAKAYGFTAILKGK